MVLTPLIEVTEIVGNTPAHVANVASYISYIRRLEEEILELRKSLERVQDMSQAEIIRLKAENESLKRDILTIRRQHKRKTQRTENRSNQQYSQADSLHSPTPNSLAIDLVRSVIDDADTHRSMPEIAGGVEATKLAMSVNSKYGQHSVHELASSHAQAQALQMPVFVRTTTAPHSTHSTIGAAPGVSSQEANDSSLALSTSMHSSSQKLSSPTVVDATGNFIDIILRTGRRTSLAKLHTIFAKYEGTTEPTIEQRLHSKRSDSSMAGSSAGSQTISTDKHGQANKPLIDMPFERTANPLPCHHFSRSQTNGNAFLRVHDKVSAPQQDNKKHSFTGGTATQEAGTISPLLLHNSHNSHVEAESSIHSGRGRDIRQKMGRHYQNDILDSIIGAN